MQRQEWQCVSIRGKPSESMKFHPLTKCGKMFTLSAVSVVGSGLLLECLKFFTIKKILNNSQPLVFWTLGGTMLGMRNFPNGVSWANEYRFWFFFFFRGPVDIGPFWESDSNRKHCPSSYVTHTCSIVGLLISLLLLPKQNACLCKYLVSHLEGTRPEDD